MKKPPIFFAVTVEISALVEVRKSIELGAAKFGVRILISLNRPKCVGRGCYRICGADCLFAVGWEMWMKKPPIFFAVTVEISALVEVRKSIELGVAKFGVRILISLNRPKCVGRGYYRICGADCLF